MYARKSLLLLFSCVTLALSAESAPKYSRRTQTLLAIGRQKIQCVWFDRVADKPKLSTMAHGGKACTYDCYSNGYVGAAACSGVARMTMEAETMWVASMMYQYACDDGKSKNKP